MVAMLPISVTPSVFSVARRNTDKPAIMGGPATRAQEWPEWPPQADEERVIAVLRSGDWSRGKIVAAFEEKWAETVVAKRALAVVNGTNALIAY